MNNLYSADVTLKERAKVRKVRFHVTAATLALACSKIISWAEENGFSSWVIVGCWEEVSNDARHIVL